MQGDRGGQSQWYFAIVGDLAGQDADDLAGGARLRGANGRGDLLMVGFAQHVTSLPRRPRPRTSRRLR